MKRLENGLISARRVVRQRENIVKRLHLHSRVDLVKYALRTGLVHLDEGRGRLCQFVLVQDIAQVGIDLREYALEQFLDNVLSELLSYHCALRL